MPHICMDEILLFMAVFPFIGVTFQKTHAWYHKKFGHKCHHVERCEETHVEHEHKHDEE
jgi:hypothetical protein